MKPHLEIGLPSLPGQSEAPVIPPNSCTAHDRASNSRLRSIVFLTPRESLRFGQPAARMKHLFSSSGGPDQNWQAFNCCSFLRHANGEVTLLSGTAGETRERFGCIKHHVRSEGPFEMRKRSTT